MAKFLLKSRGPQTTTFQNTKIPLFCKVSISFKMVKKIKVQPSSQTIHTLKKMNYHFQYYCIKNFSILLKKKVIVYPLTFFLLALVLCGYVYSVMGRLKNFENFNPVLRTVDHVSDFFLTTSIIIIALYIPKNSNNFYDFFTSLYPEGTKLLGPLLAMRKHNFWRNFLICNLCIGTLVALNASFFLIHFGWTWYRYLIFRDVEFYFYNLVLLLMLALARKLELRFAELNELLECKTEDFLKSNSKQKYGNVLEKNLSLIMHSEHFYSVRTFRIMHYNLCKLVKRYNEMFGRIMLSTIIFGIANILAKVTFIIYFVVTPKNEEDGNKWALYIGITCFWIFTNAGQAFLFSFYGDRITTEGQKTTRICFYLLNKVPFHPKKDDEKLVQDELKLLAFQSYSNIPCLSAGEFFNINFKVLGLMISSITSYLMVIIQFLLRQQNN